MDFTLDSTGKVPSRRLTTPANGNASLPWPRQHTPKATKIAHPHRLDAPLLKHDLDTEIQQDEQPESRPYTAVRISPYKSVIATLHAMKNNVQKMARTIS